MARSSARSAAAAGMVAALAAVLTTLAPALAATRDVSIDGLAYHPASVTIAEGDTVRWTNDDNTAHTVTADDGSFDSGSLAPGVGTFSRTFATAGSFPYHCEIHSSMHGTVVVSSPSASPTPSKSKTPTPAPTPSTKKSPTPSPSISRSPTPSPSVTASASAGVTPSPSPTDTLSPAPSPTESPEPSPTPSPEPSTGGAGRWPLALGAVAALLGSGALVYLRFFR